MILQVASYPNKTGFIMEKALHLLENLSNHELVLGTKATDALNRLRKSIELRNKLLAEQQLKPGQSLKKTYR